jgi:hypothetical protein
MNQNINEIEINGIEYVRKDSVNTNEKAETLDDMPYVIVRTYSAGVHAGYLASRKDKESILKKSRRLWYWKGANTLSDIANDGVKNPKECKFTQEVAEIILTESIEIIPCTEIGRKNIISVEAWK